MVNLIWQDFERYLTDSCDELESFLLSKSNRWPLGDSWGGNMFLPERMTIGNLLLAQKIHSAIAPAHSNVANCIEIAKRKWSSAWEEKIEQEWQERMRLWNYVITEIRKAEEYPASYYQNEVRNRVIQELFASDSPELLGEFKDQLNALDQLLSVLLEPGDFIWDEEMISEFDRQSFWYLYGEPR